MTSPALPKYAGADTSSLGRKMTRDEVRGRFEAENAAVYGQRLRRWLPGDRLSGKLMNKALAPYLSSRKERRVLDLGAGTGRSALGVLQAFEKCHVTLVDFSPNMLSAAPGTLQGFEGRFAMVQADIWEADFPSGGYDAIMASYALHHGRGEAVYAKLYRKSYAWLKARGIFVCCDVVDGDAPALSAMNEAGWQSYLRRKGFSQEDLDGLFSNYRCEDSPLSLRQHLALLTAAGFTAADVLWKRFNFAVYVGLKEAQQ